MKNIINLFSIVSFFVFVSCGTTKEVIYSSADFEQEFLDTLTVTAPTYIADENSQFSLPIYNSSATRSYDILHTKLELSFDWEKQYVLGEAFLDIKPIFYPIDEIALDAKQFVIHKVSLGKNGKPLLYTYDDLKLTITLGREYKKEENINIYIDYTAKPNEGPEGGSAAITSDKGLFFINPTRETTDKPRQLWTQGETENNSKWFPTFDKPNERCTQEIYLTVEEELETLSNGILVSSHKNGDGTKIDYWKMDKPHAPYLFMLMVGDFARVKDSWNGKPLEYMVDPPYKESAREIFNNTPEMLTFFSDILDYPYPWQKYSQVIAEDFVSGAMENTTSVIFGDFVQKTKRELIDNENDQIVAHEMFHHWFGNLVTCESWSNLTLNEGFANYSEYLWYEHKYGKDAADAIRKSEMSNYFYMADQSGTHPLIHYGYDDKEDMFDAHSYNKGGLVLHMLRNIVGDDAFFASLSKYLKDNQYTAVETAELRMAFEETTGQDLNWFFDQWYLDKGHPVMQVSYDYKDNQVVLYTEQLQAPEDHRPVFILPLETAIYDKNGKVTYHSIRIDQRKDTIIIAGILNPPLVTVMDGKSTLLGDVTETRTEKEWLAILEHSPNFFDKTTAIKNLFGTTIPRPITSKLLQHKNHTIRIAGIDNIESTDAYRLKKMITDDSHSSVRKKALEIYSIHVEEKALPVAEQVLENEKAYAPIKTALDIIYKYDKFKGIAQAEKLMNQSDPAMVGFLSSFFANTGDGKYLEFIENNFDKMGVYQLFNVFGKYSDLLLGQETSVILSKLDPLQDTAINSSNTYRRFLSTKTIISIKHKYTEEQESISEEKLLAENKSNIKSISAILDSIISKEKDESLLERYKYLIE